MTVLPRQSTSVWLLWSRIKDWFSHESSIAIYTRCPVKGASNDTAYYKIVWYCFEARLFANRWVHPLLILSKWRRQRHRRRQQQRRWRRGMIWSSQNVTKQHHMLKTSNIHVEMYMPNRVAHILDGLWFQSILEGISFTVYIHRWDFPFVFFLSVFYFSSQFIRIASFTSRLDDKRLNVCFTWNK